MGHRKVKRSCHSKDAIEWDTVNVITAKVQAPQAELQVPPLTPTS